VCRFCYDEAVEHIRYGIRSSAAVGPGKGCLPVGEMSWRGGFSRNKRSGVRVTDSKMDVTASSVERCTKELNMKRRKILTSAGALAGAALTGCGGGGQNAAGEIVGEIGSEIESAIEAEYAPLNDASVPRGLVPANRNHQIEVTFYTTRAIEVHMESGKGESKLIAHKSVSGGKSHKLGMAVWRCNSGEGNDRTNFYLLVREQNGSTGGWHETFAGNSNTSHNNYRYYAEHNDGEIEYEWSFYSRRDGILIARVRFFPFPDGDQVSDWAYGEYIRPIENTAMRANKYGGDVRHPTLHEPATSHARHAGVIMNSLRDTILLPVPRGSDTHHELVPCYLGASAAEKPLLKRRLLRHLHQFSKSAHAAGHRLDSTQGHHVHHMFGNEISRVLGGKGLSDHLKSTRDKVVNSIQNNFKQVGGEFEKFCKDHLPQLSSDGLEDGVRQLIAEYDNSNTSEMKLGAGLGVTVALQASATYAQKDFPWPGWNLGGGVRFSFGIAKASYKLQDNQISTDRYTAAMIPQRGLSLAATLIIKGLSGEDFKIEGVETNFTLDIEVTVHMTVLNNVWRVDLIQIDPVLDLDSRWMARLFEIGAAHLMGKTAPTDSSVPGGIEMTIISPAVIDSAASIPAFLGPMLEGAAELPIPGVEPVVDLIADAALREGIFNSSFLITEGSLLRVMLPNQDLGDPTIPFRGSFRLGSVGYQPGMKFIAGFGARKNVKIGEAEAKSFVRVVAVVDSYVLLGSTAFVDQMGFPWSM
jgi:hypothetical protein